MTSIKIGTRQSQLALWQTNHIISLLQENWPELVCEQVTFVTQGDKTLDRPLPQIGGKGLFTLELEQALFREEIDLAVHSLKDLPVEQPSGLTLGAIIGRADVRDVLIAKNGWTLDTLPAGAIVGTSSLRRQAQLIAYRPDLKVESIRGNVETRIRKALNSSDYNAVILAAAGVTRLGLADMVTQWLPLEIMLPAPGQGALAVQCRANDHHILELLAGIHSPEVNACISAERTFLNTLGGGCATPVAAYAHFQEEIITLTGLVADPDGSLQVKVRQTGRDPEALGKAMAETALARGAHQILYQSPLQGKRILITRSVDQAEDLARQLSARGARSVVFPVIAFEGLSPASLKTALAMIDKYSWLIFTSVNGVEFFFTAYEDQPLPPVAAVGSATVAKLQEFGVGVSFIPEVFTGEALARGLGSLSGQRILLPRAEKGRPEIVQQLQSQGALVDDIPLYDTVTAAPTPEQWADLQLGFDVITFTSPSSVRNFMKLTNNVWLDYLQNEARVACIGPSTAAEAEKYQLPVSIIPVEYTIEALINAIEQAYV